ncbi:MAG: DinB family protein, partial [Alphaproteobacteria bacterium]|nr:DinB family protein [Alphaproteobacteria bacterium]
MTIDVLSLLQVQAANHFLANRRLIEACATLTDTEFQAARPCFFGSIHATFDHIVTTDQRYLSRLHGTPLPPTGDDGVTYKNR